MTERTAEMIYGLTGQTFAIYPPEWSEGVPSSATCSVYEGEDGYDDTAEFSPAVTIDTVSTTVDAASGYSQTNRKKINLTATTSIAVGEFYLVGNAYGQRELVRVTKIASADYVEVDADLAYDYTTADTFKGVRMSATVDATWVATEANIIGPDVPSYRVRWAYTVNSIARRYYSYLRLVRQQATHGVTLATLRQYYHDLPAEEEAGSRGTQFRGLIDAAYGDVRQDVIRAGIKPDQIRDTETMSKLIVYRALALAARKGQLPGSRNPDAVAREWQAEYAALLASTVTAVLRIGVDQGTEGATTRSPIQQPWFSR